MCIAPLVPKLADHGDGALRFPTAIRGEAAAIAATVDWLATFALIEVHSAGRARRWSTAGMPLRQGCGEPLGGTEIPEDRNGATTWAREGVTGRSYPQIPR